MTIAVDSNVLLDIIARDPVHYDSSRQLLTEAARQDTLVVGEVVCAELASHFADAAGVVQTLDLLGIQATRSSLEALHRAGVAFREYSQRRRGLTCPGCGSDVNVGCPNCGATITPRQHVVADFMIGAHALVHAGRLLTRDRGYYATYFPDLVLV